MFTLNLQRMQALLLLLILAAATAFAAEPAPTGTPCSGTVADPTGAVIPGATVRIHNPVSGLDRTVKTDGAGHFEFANVPNNHYT